MAFSLDLMLRIMSPLQGFYGTGDSESQGGALGYCIACLWGLWVLPVVADCGMVSGGRSGDDFVDFFQG